MANRQKVIIIKLPSSLHSTNVAIWSGWNNSFISIIENFLKTFGSYDIVFNLDGNQ